ncbi:MAG: cupin domain-containing protein [Pseudomonadota bacterium]
MQLPPFLTDLPALDIPFPETAVSTNAMRSEHGLMVFFTFHEDVHLPPHSHGAQWGTVIAGSVTLTMNGETRTYRPGECYDIPAGAEHAVEVPAGTIAFDIFEEADRYALKSGN